MDWSVQPMSIFVRGAEATLGQTVYVAGVHIRRWEGPRLFFLSIYWKS